ncbi:hypothetical protein Nepgr_021780 [Nepenthes gracilis]|uniref:Uncharacterized protein n=1 Tax=Nepenthes gracilis TaxID=150966 RepID=A0AAD3SZU0_NEPGR|nr:hypothetical protein Nepgr_021780 [Nepenthes gracilis]
MSGEASDCIDNQAEEVTGGQTEEVIEGPTKSVHVEKIRATETPIPKPPCLAIQVYQEREFSSEAIQRATIKDIMFTPVASSADQAETRVVVHLEMAKSPMLVIDELVHESEIVVDVQEAKEVAVVADVAQASGQLEPEV